MIKSHKLLKMLKFDKMVKNSLFFMIKSHKLLNMPKSDKMAKNGLFA
jgi:hypothetical protein